MEKEKKPTNKKQDKVKLFVIAGIIAVVVILMKVFGVFEYISIENITKLTEWIKGFGIIGPIVYILLWIAACVFFLPGIPVALLGGFVFGPWFGVIYSSIGSTLGATAAFLVARYAARSMVEGWVAGNEQFKKIDEGVENQGWRMLMVTRLVPVFPFNLQNYAYGLTKIKLATYVLVSWICMLPGTIAFSFAGGSVVSGEGNLGKTFMYLGVAAVFFVIISLIPGWIQKRQNAEGGKKVA
ncbi:TVP38/TMEM64 family protein [Desulfitibacter alkalitolerans]|uniref:TVP38/TMEM64 family protein n=1 Tax=Desulfitibacter alkalitolerans TaxID=264641 RepID=UPI000684FD89|nr:TVP38/TMEM64 family protein [Desulfitibacter alkalitolerans]